MNWGKRIILGMGLFIAFITTLIVMLMSNRVDLVSEDYYQREIDYSSEMTARQNALDHGGEVQINQSEDQVLFVLPEIEGVNAYELHLSRPDDQKKDLHYSISETRNWLISRDKMEKGWYDYELTASDGHKKYLIGGQYLVK